MNRYLLADVKKITKSSPENFGYYLAISVFTFVNIINNLLNSTLSKMHT